jgi:hypothetical protein
LWQNQAKDVLGSPFLQEFKWLGLKEDTVLWFFLCLCVKKGEIKAIAFCSVLIFALPSVAVFCPSSSLLYFNVIFLI